MTAESISVLAHDLPLQGALVEIRTFGPEDLTPEYVGWLNDAEVVRYSNQRFRRHDARSCAAYLQSFPGTDNLFLSVRRKDDGHAIGTMTVYYARHHGTADVGILIGDRKVWGQGYGQDAWNTVVHWLAGHPAVRKVTAGTVACNSGMLKLMERSGMKKEAVRERQEIIDGDPVDILYFAKHAMTEVRAPFAAVCHDAGAANQVIAWIRSSGAIDAVRPVMRGPAERLWRAAFPARALIDDLATALADAHMLVSGTGWGSELEHEARAMARARGIRSIAVLDHWVNYRQRFERGGTQVLPDEFWVFDEHAYRLAQETFPGSTVRRLPNRYLEDQLRGIGPVPASGAECLYLLEPMRTDWGRGVPGEFQALDYFVEKLPLLKLPPQTVIRLRPHPSESASKYADWMREHPDLRLAIDDSDSLAGALSRSGWVVGCESFGLVVALASNRQVQCALPPWAPPCRLPHEGLVHLSRLAGTP